MTDVWLNKILTSTKLLFHWSSMAELAAFYKAFKKIPTNIASGTGGVSFFRFFRPIGTRSSRVTDIFRYDKEKRHRIDPARHKTIAFV